MNSIRTCLCFLLIIAPITSFQPSSFSSSLTHFPITSDSKTFNAWTKIHALSSSSSTISTDTQVPEATTTPSTVTTQQTSAMTRATVAATAVAATTTTFLLPTMAFATEVEYEVAELPPVYIPVVFAVLILGGVGWLTSSLGNVLDEEASLGLQSGARAKKERERSRSSYFNKR